MHCSRLRALRWRNMLSKLTSTQKSVKQEKQLEVTGDTAITEEAEAVSKKILKSLKSGDKAQIYNGSENDEFSDVTSTDEIDIDSIRARGFLKYRYNYTPPADLEIQVKNTLDEVLFHSNDDIRSIDLTRNRQLKFQLLSLLGERLCHVVPNSELHSIKTVGDLIDFYGRPFRNLTKYAQMARDNKRTLPKNLHIIEHPFRFHPEDIHSYHGGETAFPGKGGEVISLRNKRLYRQFKPKEHWFDYEEETFDYERPDKGMPWDPEIAERMDQYPTKRYNLKAKGFRRT